MSSSSWHPQRDSTVLQRLAEVVQVPAEHQHVTRFSSWWDAWWREHARLPLEGRQRQSSQRERCSRQLERQRPLDVEAVHEPSNVTNRLSYHLDPEDRWRPDARRVRTFTEHQLSLQSAWPGPGGAQLSGSASHTSAGGGGGGGGVSVTGSAPLDAQRHSTLFAAAQAYTDEPPSVEVELDDRQYSLLLRRYLFRTHRVQYTPADRECAVTTSTGTQLLADALRVSASLGTDLRNATFGFEADLEPGRRITSCAWPRQPAQKDAPPWLPMMSLQRLNVHLVQQVATKQTQFRLEGEEQLNQQGLTVGAAYLSEEGKLRPASWHCEARYPALRAGKTLAVRLSGSGSPDGNRTLSCELAPPPDGSGGFAWRAECSRASSPEVGVTWKTGSEDDYIEDGMSMATVSANWQDSKRANVRVDLVIPH